MSFLVLFLITALAGRFLFRTTLRQNIIQGYAGSYSNNGFIGLAIVPVILGDWARLPCVTIVAADVAVTVPIVLILLELCRPQRTSWYHALTVACFRTLTQPLFLAAVIGLLLALSDWDLPSAINNVLQLLGSAAAPCALFALGASLAQRLLPEEHAEVTFLVSFKLLLHPLIAWLSMTVVFAVDPKWATVGLLSAALPTAATVFVFAEHYRAHVTTASSTILMSTVVSLVTIPAMLYLII